MKQQTVIQRRLLPLLIILFALSAPAFLRTATTAEAASPYLVNLTLDASEPFSATGDGICDIFPGTPELECTLRAALNEANANAGPDDILFAIPTAGTGPITLTIDASIGPLPPLIDAGTSILGASQLGTTCATSDEAVHQLMIVIDGSAFRGTESGLVVFPTSGGVQINGLSIVNFPANGIELNGGPSNLVTCSHIGVGADGVSAMGNSLNGIFINDSANNAIGDGSPEGRNVISANGANGIAMMGASAENNDVQGNRIGTTASGGSALGNVVHGVALIAGAHDNMVGGTRGAACDGDCNVISGNGEHGVFIDAAANNNDLRANFVGTDVTGSASVANLLSGVYVRDSAETTIGGFITTTRNIISGNASDGVTVFTSVSPVVSATGTTVYNNYIGLANDGTSSLPNGANGATVVRSEETQLTGNRISHNAQDGISVQTSSATGIESNFLKSNGANGVATIDSGFVYMESNLVHSNVAHGVLISGTDSAEIAIFNSIIGLQADLTTAAGNGGDGIRVVDASIVQIGIGEGTMVRGDSALTNTITANGGNGVSVLGTASSVTIEGNVIYDNEGLGIDLGDDDVTDNDSMDSDSGPNSLQNHAVLTAGSLSTLLVELDSLPSVNFNVDIYTNESCDESDHGEGKTYQGSLVLATDSSGYASQTISMTSSLAGHFVTALTTNTDGDTSEFSACAELTNDIIVNSANDVDDSRCDAAHCSLREAIDAVNAGSGEAIDFAIPGDGPHIITPTSALPEIRESVKLDGTTQPGTSCPGTSSAATLMIEIDGSLAGSADGLLVSASMTEIYGLAIHSFAAVGIEVFNSSGIVIGCTHVGTDTSGTAAGLGNEGDGIRLSNVTTGLIGGFGANMRNVVVSTFDPSPARVHGIRLNNSEQIYVAQNFIGVDATGLSALGNEGVGVRIDGGTNIDLVMNVISGNGDHGVHVLNSAETTLVGNNIGVGSDSSTPIGNGNDGVHIWNAYDTQVRGSSLSRGETVASPNIIAHNSNDGVVVRQTGALTATGNTILSNQIYSNTNQGIDLGNNGITLNDSDDADSGANGWLNFPVLDSALTSDSGISVTLSLDLPTGHPSTVYVEFYENDACDGSHGEGQTVLGGSTLTLDADGDLETTVAIPGNATAGSLLTALVTDDFGNTSEFSACITISAFVPTAVSLATGGAASQQASLIIFCAALLALLATTTWVLGPVMHNAHSRTNDLSLSGKLSHTEPTPSNRTIDSELRQF